MCSLDTINYLFYKVLFTTWYCQGMFVFYWCIPQSIYRPMKTCRAILSLAVVVPKWLLWTVSTYISGKSLDTCMKWRETPLGEPLCPWSSEQGVFFPVLSLAAWILWSFLHSGPASTWRTEGVIFSGYVMVCWKAEDPSFCLCSLKLRYFTLSSCVMLHVKVSLTFLGLVCSVLAGIIRYLHHTYRMLMFLTS